MASRLASIFGWFTGRNNSFPYPTKQVEDSASKLLQISTTDLPPQSKNFQEIESSSSYVAELFGSFSTILDPPNELVEEKIQACQDEQCSKVNQNGCELIPKLVSFIPEPVNEVSYQSMTPEIKPELLCKDEEERVQQQKRKYNKDMEVQPNSVPLRKTHARKQSKFVPKIKLQEEKPVCKITKVFQDLHQKPVEIQVMEEKDVFVLDSDLPEFVSPIEESSIDNDEPTSSDQVDVAQRDVTKVLKECVRRFSAIEVTEGYQSALGRLPIVKERMMEFSDWDCMNKEE